MELAAGNHLCLAWLCTSVCVFVVGLFSLRSSSSKGSAMQMSCNTCMRWKTQRDRDRDRERERQRDRNRAAEICSSAHLARAKVCTNTNVLLSLLTKTDFHLLPEPLSPLSNCAHFCTPNWAQLGQKENETHRRRATVRLGDQLLLSLSLSSSLTAHAWQGKAADIEH